MPVEAAVTFTVTIQEPLAGIEPPVRVTVEPPVGAVTVPPQVVLGLPETTTPLGNVSVSAAVSVATVLLGLFNVMVRVETPPEVISAGRNALLRVTADGGAETVKVATAATVLLPLLVCNAPTASVLMQMLPVAAVTFTVTVQEPLAGIE